MSGQVLTCVADEVAVGAEATFVFTARVVTAGAVVNSATVTTSASTDPNDGNNTATFASLAGTAADLAIAKDGPVTITAGGTVTYTITVTNAGPSPAAGVTVTDAVPPGLTVTSAAASPGTCAIGPPVSHA